jgi:vancomycin resistance protein YoaR
MLIDAGMYNNKIHAGVTIEGQDMSGLTADEAAATLNRQINEASNKPITLVSDAKTWDVKPYEMGVKIDVSGAVSAAMEVTRESNVFVDMARKLNLYFNGMDIPLEGTVDTAAIDGTIEQLAAELDVPAVNAGLAINGVTVEVIEGQNGLAVDRDALRERFTEVLLTLHSTEITIPMISKEPDVQAEDNEKARSQAQTMISAPLTLKSGEQTWTFTPEEIASYLDFKSEDQNGVSTLVPYLSVEKMATKLGEITPLVGVAPIDASFDSDGKKAWVVPGTDGTTLDTEKTAEALNSAALKTSGRTVEAPITTKEADLTTAEAEAMGIKDLLASYSTPKYTGTPNRQVNVRLTTEYATAGDAAFLAPGEEYNFLQTVGPRTKERGYLRAPGIVPGIAMEDVYGGGICQVSTTLFNAAFLAGLEITERRNHTIYIWHYPMGLDATATDEGANLRFVNSTDHYIWIKGKSDGIKTTFNIYGTDDGRKVTYTTSKWFNVWGPYPQTTLDPSLPAGVTAIADPGQTARMCKVTRTITWPDGRTQVDEFESNYKHRWTIIRVGTGTATTTTTTAPPPSTDTTTATTTVP